jgi:hypothetical protein
MLVSQLAHCYHEESNQVGRRTIEGTRTLSCQLTSAPSRTSSHTVLVWPPPAALMRAFRSACSARVYRQCPLLKLEHATAKLKTSDQTRTHDKTKTKTTRRANAHGF